MAAYSLGALYALWVFFLAVMNLQRASVAGTLPKVCTVLGLPLIIVAYLLDVAVNMVATVLLLEIPREWTLSERLERLSLGQGWRARVAVLILAYLLNPFDTTGGHRAG